MSVAHDRRLREPWRGAGGTEAERRLRAVPRQRHAAAVAAGVGAAGLEVHRILEVLGRQVLDLGEAELLALVHVQRPGQGGDEQRSGAGPADAEGEVGRRADALGGERERRVGAAVAGDRPG